MITWQDLPRKTDKVAIVGFAPSTRHLAPFDDPEYEIFILNEEYNFPWCKRFDRLFQMHQRWDWNRTNNFNHPNHGLWLRNISGPCLACEGKGKFVPLGEKEEIICPDCAGGLTYTANRKTDFPIYMQQAWEDVPGSVAFPLEEAGKFLGHKYFRSGFSYMFTLAMLMGYPHIALYGFEMGSDTEYHYQKANGEWLIGVAQGKGIDVYLPDECTLLKGNIYGYEDSRVGFRQNLEIRKLVLDNQIKKQKEKVARSDAQADLVREIISHPEWNLNELLVKKAQEFNKANGMLNFVRGAKTETENLIQMHDKYFRGPSEQDDPIAYNYKITEENVKVEYAAEE